MEKEEAMKMRQLGQLEKRVIYPNVQFYGAYIHDGEDVYLCNDIEEDEDGKIEIENYIKENILYTNLKKNYKTVKGRVITEDIRQSVSVNKGEVLVYIPDTGFVVPEYNMITIPEAIDIYKLLINENGGNENESIRNSEESIETDRRD